MRARRARCRQRRFTDLQACYQTHSEYECEPASVHARSPLWPLQIVASTPQKSTHLSNFGRQFKVFWPRRLPAFGTARERANTATNAQRSLRCAAEHKTGSIANAVSSTSPQISRKVLSGCSRRRGLSPSGSACTRSIAAGLDGLAWTPECKLAAKLHRQRVQVGCVITPMRPSVGAEAATPCATSTCGP